jgi:hypothetical protein
MNRVSACGKVKADCLRAIDEGIHGWEGPGFGHEPAMKGDQE